MARYPHPGDWGSIPGSKNLNWRIIALQYCIGICHIIYTYLLPHTKSWLIGKDSDAGRDWGQEEKGTTEDEMAGWHHRLDGHEFEWTPGVGDGQGGLACCDSWGRKESDTTERLNWTELTDLLPLELPFYPRPPPHLSRSSQSTELNSLCYTAASHWPSVLHVVVYYVSANLPIHPTLPFPCCLHKSVLSVSPFLPRK